MGAQIKPSLTILLLGTSLSPQARLCTPPLSWGYYLQGAMQMDPACKGQVRIVNAGVGSATSTIGITTAQRYAPLKPDIVLMEDYGINDCAIGPVSLPQQTANLDTIRDILIAANPDVLIVHQTMSSASAGDAARTNLAAYYANGLAWAASHGIVSIDNYNGTVIVPGGWPKPLPQNLTVPDAPFAIAPTSGYVGLPIGTTWNPADKSASINLTNGNLTATSTAGAFSGARATAVIAGKVHFEVTITLKASASPAVGVASLAAPLNGITNSPNGLALAADGNVFTNSTNIGASGLVPATGNVIGVEIDTVAQLAYFMKDSFRSAGFSTAGITGALYPAGVWESGVTAAATAQFSTGGDGLHPLWTNAFQLYSFPNILPVAITWMENFWPD